MHRVPRRRRAVWTCAVALVSFAAAAQEHVGRFERLSVDDGLSHSTVFAVHQDSQGFLWIGTQEGLNRHDGFTFKVFKHDPEDPRSLSHSYVESIFELFERLDPDEEGSGIGLALARRVIEAHGGRIWVESAGAGTGSTFCFTLPTTGARDLRS